MNANLICEIPTVLWRRLTPHCIKRIFFSIPHGNVGQVTNSLGSKFFCGLEVACPILWCFVEQNHQDTYMFLAMRKLWVLGHYLIKVDWKIYL